MPTTYDKGYVAGFDDGMIAALEATAEQIDVFGSITAAEIRSSIEMYKIAVK